MNNDFSNIGVLVVDDELPIRSLVKSVLNDLGITNVFTAKNGEEAFEIIQESADIHIIICDWMMPCVTGLEFLQQIRMAQLDLPFIMLTSLADSDAVVDARASGVSDYLVKPFTANDLKRKLLRLEPMRAAPQKKAGHVNRRQEVTRYCFTDHRHKHDHSGRHTPRSGLCR